MYEKQHTIQQPVSVTGVGLHTGESATMTFNPAPENHGYIFRRTDLPGTPLVPADVDNVVDTQRGTTIEANGARVHTVEHTLAALAGLQIDNCLIDLDGPEPPIMDGSSVVFIEALMRAGLHEQQADREFFVVDQPIHYYESDRQVDLAALPMDDFRVTVMIDYNSPVLGSQHATLLNIENFAAEFADSRTFCFLHELEALANAGLIKGGDINNAIVVVDREVTPSELERLAVLFDKPNIEVADEGILNNIDLRHRNEPARHKLLDLIGDLALIGAPLKGQILAARPGHKANVELAKKIKSLLKQKKIQKKYQQKEATGVIFDVNAIQKILPHRYPFLLVDKITEFSENEITGVKNVTVNEPFFQGHFPGNPVMPGVLQLEAMAQVGGILLLNKVENPEKVWVYFLAINNARFKKMVIPGDVITFKLQLDSLKRNICKMYGKAYVDGKLVCEAELVAAVVDKDKM
ncbi:MAG: bifunctional UDP-3-O-[3-hydroxymyristoyl] N-acetylglucosamine deacetylase/3-hydroxyacyl-ACP dehydratase [Bacteroidetes bacterium]|nr:bifunctional UDP-3-O-[3-hydroxymyristoyl] N-acetylglucosamine deacetylase/3-hydroxyacyl-ACP dehydratase [Bacteroidota bacterium]